MLPQTIADRIDAAHAALTRLKTACGIVRGYFTAADAERLIAGLLADQLDHCRLKRGAAAFLNGFSSSVLQLVRLQPRRVRLKTLTSLADELGLMDCLETPLADMKLACRLDSPMDSRRWKSSSLRFPDTHSLLAAVQAGYENIVRNDWSQAGAYLVALRSFSGISLTSLAAELKESPLVLLRRELDEYRDDSPRSLRQVHAAFTAIGNRIIG